MMKVGVRMKFGEKLQSLRKEKGLSQEGLAELLAVSRQSVSKWESGGAYPEMEKLIILSDLFGLTLDNLIKDGDIQRDGNNLASEAFWQNRGSYYERKSKRALFGLPLVHINLGHGKRRAKGIIAIGNTATGVIAIGFASVGLLSFGVASIGLISLGAVSLAALLSIGAISVGTISIGAISVGVFTVGAVSAGMFSIGAVASATHVAIGHTVSGRVAIGEAVKGVSTITVADSNHVFSTVSRSEVQTLITREFPNMWKWITDLIVGLFHTVK